MKRFFVGAALVLAAFGQSIAAPSPAAANTFVRTGTISSDANVGGYYARYTATATYAAGLGTLNAQCSAAVADVDHWSYVPYGYCWVTDLDTRSVYMASTFTSLLSANNLGTWVIPTGRRLQFCMRVDTYYARGDMRCTTIN